MKTTFTLIVRQNGSVINESTHFELDLHKRKLDGYDDRIARVETTIELVDEEELDLGRVQGEHRRFKKPVK